MSDETDLNVDNLDMGSKADRVIVRTALKRWGVSDDLKARLIEKTAHALELAEKPREIVSIGKLLKDLESQNQADDHLADKNARLDDGKPTDAVEHYIVEMPKPRDSLE